MQYKYSKIRADNQLKPIEFSEFMGTFADNHSISSKDLMNYYVEYFPIKIQNNIVDFYKETIVPQQKELEKAKENLSNKINSLL